MKPGIIKVGGAEVEYNPRKDDSCMSDDPVAARAVKVLIDAAPPKEGYDPEPHNTRLEYAARTLGGTIIQRIDYENANKRAIY